MYYSFSEEDKAMRNGGSSSNAEYCSAFRELRGIVTPSLFSSNIRVNPYMHETPCGRSNLSIFGSKNREKGRVARKSQRSENPRKTLVLKGFETFVPYQSSRNKRAFKRAL